MVVVDILFTGSTIFDSFLGVVLCIIKQSLSYILKSGPKLASLLFFEFFKRSI